MLSEPHLSSCTAQQPTRVRYLVLAVLCGLAAFTYLDRVCISLAAPWLERDLHLRPEQMGFIFSIFALGYALFEVPTGRLADGLGPRRVFTRVLAWWSAFTAATGWTHGFVGLTVTRFLFGAGEAGAYPNMTRAIAAWFPRRRRGMAMGTLWMASRLGAAIAPPIVLFAIARIGWRGAFQVLGLIGFVLAALWYLWFRDTPLTMRGVNAAELYLITEDTPANAEAHIGWRTILSSRSLLALDLMYFTLGFTYYLYISWFPMYLVQHRHVAATQLVVYASMPPAFSIVAAIAGGLLTDRLVPWLGLSWARRLVGIIGCLSAGVCLLCGVMASRVSTSVLLISLAAASSDFVLAVAWACCADIGGSAAGAVSGAMNMTGNIGSALSPALMGVMIEKTGNWDLTFLLAAAFNLAGALLWTLIHAERSLPTQRQPDTIALGMRGTD